MYLWEMGRCSAYQEISPACKIFSWLRALSLCLYTHLPSLVQCHAHYKLAFYVPCIPVQAPVSWTACLSVEHTYTLQLRTIHLNCIHPSRSPLRKTVRRSTRNVSPPLAFSILPQPEQRMTVPFFDLNDFEWLSRSSDRRTLNVTRPLNLNVTRFFIAHYIVRM